MPILKVLRTPTHGAVGADLFTGFGTVLRPIPDPDGVEIKAELFGAIRLAPQYKPLPTVLANAISNLYVRMMGLGVDKAVRDVSGGKNEVSVVLLLDEATLSQWRVLVPTQLVGGAFVNADYDKPLCDILTGEEVTQFPPPGWLHAGSSHSHNSMGAFFSGTDDRNELPIPGVHFVCGQFRQAEGGEWSFAVAPSIVYMGKRYERVIGEDGKPRAMTWSDVALFDPTNDTKAHDNVLNYVKLEQPENWDSKGFQSGLGYTRYERDSDDYGFGYGLGYGLGSGLDRWKKGEDGIFRLRGDDDSNFEVPEIDGDITEEAFDAWCQQFERATRSSKYKWRTPKPKKKTPVLCFPDNIENIERCTYLELGPCPTRISALRQKRFGDIEIDDGITYQTDGDEKDKYHYYTWASDKTLGMTELVRVFPHYGMEVTAIAKKQRRSLRVSAKRRGNVKPDVVEFSTRGINMKELTESEIIDAVKCWASTIEQRTSLRLALAKIQDQMALPSDGKESSR